MGRQRMHRPEMFVDESLNSLDPLCRWVYMALHHHADRAGRLVDRPGTLRAQCVPHDAVSKGGFDQMLWALATTEEPLITRYTVNGQHYLQINNWNQRCHHREPPSEIPSVDQGVTRSPEKVRQRPVKVRPSPLDTETESVTETETETDIRLPSEAGEPAAPVAAAVADDRSKEPYVVEAGEDWESAYAGLPPFGRIGKALKPLVKRHTWLVVRPAWKNYLRETPAEYASPQRFVATFGHWQVEATVRRLPQVAGPPKIDPAFLESVFRGGKA